MTKALMVVDVQFGMFFGPWALPESESLLSRIGNRILSAREAGMAIIQVQNDGPTGDPDAPGEPMWQLIFAPLENELVLQKSVPNVFQSNPGLAEKLKTLGIQELELVGVQSELCLLESAKGASALGFGVSSARELHGTFDGGYPGSTSGPSAKVLSDQVQLQIEALTFIH